MDSSIKTPNLKPKRRSSIFKPSTIEDQQQLQSKNDYPEIYKELLETEIEKWKLTIKSLKHEYIDLKCKLQEPKEVKIDRDLLKKDFDLDIFDHTLYYDYLESVQNLATKFECLLDKKEQEEIINYNNKYNLMLQIKDKL